MNHLSGIFLLSEENDFFVHENFNEQFEYFRQ